MAENNTTTKKTRKPRQASFKAGQKTIYNTTSADVINKHFESVVDVMKELKAQLDNDKDNKALEKQLLSLQFVLDSAVEARNKMVEKFSYSL